MEPGRSWLEDTAPSQAPGGSKQAAGMRQVLWRSESEKSALPGAMPGQPHTRSKTCHFCRNTRASMFYNPLFLALQKSLCLRVSFVTYGLSPLLSFPGASVALLASAPEQERSSHDSDDLGLSRALQCPSCGWHTSDRPRFPSPSVFSVCKMRIIPTSANSCETCKLSSQQLTNEWGPFPPCLLLAVANVSVILP